jgi:ankyrin repeat protein
MRSNRPWVNRMLTTAAILACILSPVSGIAADPSVNEQLLQAAESGSLDQISALLAQGGDVNAEDENGRTVLMKAARSVNIEALKLLIDRGADVNAKDEKGFTALMAVAERYADRGRNLEVVKLLVDKGLDVNAKDKKGQTALSLASGNNQPEIVQYLKAHGAK